MKEIPKRYEPKEYEEKWANQWVEKKSFASLPNEKEPYSIAIPPPNVTGVLHMGHALNNVLQDIIIRVHTAMKKNPMWMPGTDHGGIATQNVVEKMLHKEGKTRHDLGREKFLERMWNWKEESGGTIISQLKRLGCGCDWDRLRFTMDEQCSEAVREAFKRLADKKLIYRGSRMINWCPRCQTALADIEVEYEEKDSHLWYIRYPYSEGEGYVVVATTRPETMLGDTAVAVNPKDERFAGIIGKTVKLPLTSREIPVVADEFVDMEFGTGCVKVTPAHDPNDEEIGVRHNLDEKVGRFVIIDRDGKMTPAVPEKHVGLDRFECRKQVVNDLKDHELIEKIENYHHAVGTCYRCSTVIEPLQQLQWFLKMKEMAAAAAVATREGKVRFYPESWSKPYLNWLDNMKDWCLSRQIWWGHQIPIWYCGKCDGDKIFITFNEEFYAKHEKAIHTKASYTELKEYLSHEEIIKNADYIYVSEDAKPIVATETPDKCDSCGDKNILQDPDVLDTWFSSALWPFSTLGWPKNNKELKYYYPTNVLVTGHEILYLWVARMVMMGLEMAGDIPFSCVNIHGIIRDEFGNKMSKSKGNVIDPLGIIDVYGTDALRFSLAKSAVPGRDIQLSEDDFIGARNFCNKLWNATRLILSNIEIKELKEPDINKLELADKWILYQANKFTEDIKKGYLEFNNAYTARQAYEFIWKYFCDWYLELAKIRLYSKGQDRESVETVLITVLMRILNLMHPIMPFISSQLWEYLAEEIKLPSADIMDFNGFDVVDYGIDIGDVEKMNKLMEVISGIRNIRGENAIQPSVKLKAKIKTSDEEEKLINEYVEYIKILGGLREIKIGVDIERESQDAVAVTGNISVFVTLPEELKKQEKIRLEKKIIEMRKQVDFAHNKLRNRDFVGKAPVEIVDRAKNKSELLEKELEKLEVTFAELNGVKKEK